ncbi:MAG: hydroxymethylglutaryl-CoA lyase [Myxococcota bacterium]
MELSKDRVRIFEVGPRDGLQNEDVILSVDQKVEMIHRLVDAGARDIEIGSFVHPDWIPQLADTDEVARRIERRDDVRYWALVPNQKGLERALDAGITHVATFMSASETHNRKNVNRTIGESLRCLEESYEIALREGCTVRAYVSTVFGCPYEGDVDFDRVMDISGQLLEFGADMISLGDTIGAGTPLQVRRECARALETFGADRLALHLHDTQGMALTNAFVAYELGMRAFDSSVGALGGCPYAPGAAGNLGTEDLVHLFEEVGAQTGVELDHILETTRWIEETTDISNQSRYYQYCEHSDSDTACAG